jgi:hypothetical protein
MAGNGGSGGSIDPVDSSIAMIDDAAPEAARDASDATDMGIDAGVDAGAPKRPTGIVMSTTSSTTTRQAPSAGGAPYSDECPANQALIGFKGTVDMMGGPTNLRSVQGVCAPLVVGANPPYAIAVGATTLLPVRQTPSTVAQSVTCPTNQVIVGFDGRTAAYIEALNFKCSPLSISGTSPSFTLNVGTVTTIGPIGAATAGTTFAAITCPAGQVAVAQAPHAGSAIDSFGLVCRTPMLVTQ